MSTVTRERLPEGIDAMPPGPSLGAVLAGVDPGAVAVVDLPVLLRAQERQAAHERARMLATVRECALADPRAPGGRRGSVDEFAADEVRAVLVCSRFAAWKLVTLAEDVAVRLPAVGGALERWLIDEERARVLAEGTELLSEGHARRVVAELLDEAPGVTRRRLEQRVAQVAAALDPEWA